MDNDSNIALNFYTLNPTHSPTIAPTSEAPMMPIQPPPGFEEIIPTAAPPGFENVIPSMTELSTINLNQHNIHEWAILDSGATSHFLLTTAPTTNKKAALNPLHVTMPDGNQVQSTHTCELDIPQLPANARDDHIVPGLAAHSLLSIVKLCNAGCDVTLSKIKCEVKYRGRLVMRGSKYTRTGLWFVNIDRNCQPGAKNK